MPYHQTNPSLDCVADRVFFNFLKGGNVLVVIELQMKAREKSQKEVENGYQARSQTQ